MTYITSLTLLNQLKAGATPVTALEPYSKATIAEPLIINEPPGLLSSMAGEPPSENETLHAPKAISPTNSLRVRTNRAGWHSISKSPFPATHLC